MIGSHSDGASGYLCERGYLSATIDPLPAPVSSLVAQGVSENIEKRKYIQGMGMKQMLQTYVRDSINFVARRQKYTWHTKIEYLQGQLAGRLFSL
jgi:hypothetical protein